MKYRKSQSSIEFLIIFVFVFVLFFLFVSFVISNVAQYNNKKNELSLDDFSKIIISEYQIMQKVQNGYQREIQIPSSIENRYNLSVEENYILIQNLEVGLTKDVFYYAFIGKGTVKLFFEDKDNNGFNETYLFFKRD